MVFSSVSSEPESPPSPPTVTGPKPATMAFTVTPKSKQTLHKHNFSLAGFKWTVNSPVPPAATTTNAASQYARQRGSKHDGSSQSHRSPLNDPAFDRVNRGPSIERSSEKKVRFSDYLVEDSEDKAKSSTVSDGKSRFLIRFRPKKNKCADEVSEAGVENPVPDVIDDTVPKTWNLRPRKPVPKPSIGGPSKTGAPLVQRELKTSLHGRTELAGSRAGTETRAAEKRKFSISLSKDEIEEDFLAMTGSKPSKKPRKRAKHVQKQLDVHFSIQFNGIDHIWFF